MKRSGGKATMGKSSKIVERKTGKTRGRVQSTSLTKALSRFGYEPLPFVKKLSKKSAPAARVLEDSYMKGVATAATGDLRDLFRTFPLAKKKRVTYRGGGKRT